MTRKMMFGLLVALAVSGCDDKAADDTADGETEDTGAPVGDTDASYADVAPILAAHCTGCHTDGGPAPFPLDSYDDAASRSARLVARAVDGEGGPMPPSGLSLTDEEEAILIGWDAAGAPE